MSKSDKLLSEAPISKAFIRLAAPAVVAQLVNITYNLIDKMYVGHISAAGADALAGVGVTTPIIFAMSSFAIIASLGGAPRISMLMGENNISEAEKVMGSCTWLLSVISITLTALILIFGQELCWLFGASETSMPYAIRYLRICCLGILFMQLTLGLSSFIGAQGKTFISMWAVIIGAVLNIILDAIFVAGFSLGVAGTALGTVIAQGVSACFVVGFLRSKKTELRLSFKNIHWDKKRLLPCIVLGASPALMQLTENIVALSFNTSLHTHGGDIAIASMSILTSIMQFVMLLLPGLVQGVQSLLSYNFGANNIDRVKATFRLLLISCVSGSLIVWLLCMSIPGAIASFFTNDAQLVEYTTTSMRIYFAMMLFYGIQVACQYSFVALDQPKKAIFLTIWRKIILLIPLIFLLPILIPNASFAVFLAEPISDALAVCVTAPMFYAYYKKL